jgi:DNA-binding NarL/FixJ family response regulator
LCPTVANLIERAEVEHPNVILLELTSSITLDTLRKLMAVAGGAAVVLWIDEVSTEFASQALAIGVRGLLRKSLSLELQAKCMRKVAAGEMWVEKALSDKLLSTRRVNLTTRERELLGLLSQGLKNKEIGFEMGITEGTVKVYLTRLYKKVGTADRFEMALFTLKNSSAQQGGGPVSSSQAPFVPSFVTMERAIA